MSVVDVYTSRFTYMKKQNKRKNEYIKHTSGWSVVRKRKKGDPGPIAITLIILLLRDIKKLWNTKFYENCV